MNKIQSQQLDQFQNTNFELTGSENIWNLPSYGRFVINVNEFRDSTAEVIRYKMMQLTDQGGAREFARLARIDMAEKSVKVRSAVQNFASDTGDALLFQQVRFPKSKLMDWGIQKSLTYAHTIESKARLNITDLLPYNMTLAELDAYKLSIEKFENANLRVSQIRSERKHATAQLKLLCPATRVIVETKLRTGATQFMETAPDFYAKLVNSFRIEDYPTHYTEFDIFIKDKATGMALNGVKITATSDKGTMEQFSNPVGEVDFKQFEPAWWTIIYECPGYEILTMSNVKAERGVRMELVAELVKVV